MGSERRLPAAAARQPEALLGWMESLADPTRLRLLRLLERHELGVAELVRRAAAAAVDGEPAPEGPGRPGLGAQPRRRARPTSTGWTVAEREPAARRLWTLTRGADGRLGDGRAGPAAARPGGWPSASRARRFFAGAAGRWDRLRERALRQDASRRRRFLAPAARGLGGGRPRLRHRPGDGGARAARAARARRRPVRGHAEGGAPADGRARRTSS